MCYGNSMPTMKKAGTKQRAFTMEVLKGSTTSKAGNKSGYNQRPKNMLLSDGRTMEPVNKALTTKLKDITLILNELREMVQREPETALKWSDKTRAVELMLKYYGALGGEDSKITQNILNINVKDASEAELLATLSALQGEKERLDNNTEHPSSAPKERA